MSSTNPTGPVSCSDQWIGDGYCDDINNNADFIVLGTCGGIASFIGDTYCDDSNNNLECNYDGGDCCGANVNTNWCTECLCLEDGSTILPSSTVPSTTPSTTYIMTTSIEQENF